MNNNSKVKIKVSNNAYDFLDNLLKFHTEYDCVSLEENPSTKCCKSPKVQIGLSNSSEFHISDKIENITFSYNSDLCNNISEITLVLKDSTLHAKVNTINKGFDSLGCSGCSKGKKGCGGCSGCN